MTGGQALYTLKQRSAFGQQAVLGPLQQREPIRSRCMRQQIEEVTLVLGE